MKTEGKLETTKKHVGEWSTLHDLEVYTQPAERIKAGLHKEYVLELQVLLEQSGDEGKVMRAALERIADSGDEDWEHARIAQVALDDIDDLRDDPKKDRA